MVCLSLPNFFNRIEKNGFHEDDRDAGDKLRLQFTKLKPARTVLEDTLTHLPDMRFVDIIARPIVVVSMWGEKWDLLDYIIFRQHIILKLPKS